MNRAVWTQLAWLLVLSLPVVGASFALAGDGKPATVAQPPDASDQPQTSAAKGASTDARIPAPPVKVLAPAPSPDAKRVEKRRATSKKKRAKRRKAAKARKKNKRQKWPIRRPSGVTLKVPEFGPAPYEPGERLLYKVKMFGTDAGEAILAVGQRTTYKGESALPLVGFIRSGEFLNKFYPINDRMVVLVNEETLQPLKTDFYVRENKKAVDYHNVFDQRARFIRSVRKKDGKDTHRNFTTGSAIYEPLGSVYGARRINLAVGQSFSYYVWDGRKERLLVVKAVAEERIWTEAGWFDTVKMQISSTITGGFIKRDMLDRPERTGTVWFAKDRWKTPVKMISPTKLGDAEVILARRYRESLPTAEAK